MSNHIIRGFNRLGFGAAVLVVIVGVLGAVGIGWDRVAALPAV
jgi:hypothetical protein